MSMASMPASVVSNLAAIALEKQCHCVDASNLASMSFEAMPDLWTELRRAGMERHRGL